MKSNWFARAGRKEYEGEATLILSSLFQNRDRKIKVDKITRCEEDLKRGLFAAKQLGKSTYKAKMLKVTVLKNECV